MDLEKQSLFNIIINQPDIHQIYLYAKYPYGAKYQLLTNKRESKESKYLNDSKGFMGYSNDKDNIYKNIKNTIQVKNEGYYYLPDGLYFEYVIKQHEKVAYDSPIITHVNKGENRITYRIKTGSYLHFLMPETMKILGSTKSKITKHENGEHFPGLEIIEVV